MDLTQPQEAQLNPDTAVCQGMDETLESQIRIMAPFGRRPRCPL